MRVLVWLPLALIPLQSTGTLAGVVTLSCTGNFFAPDLSHAASQTSGSVIVDLDKKEVRGIISGYITKVGEIELDFEWKFQSNNYSDSPTVYRRGHINGLTGEAWQVDSRSDLLVPKSDTADYAAFDLVCKRAARAIRFRGSGN